MGVPGLRLQHGVEAEIEALNKGKASVYHPEQAPDFKDQASRFVRPS